VESPYSPPASLWLQLDVTFYTHAPQLEGDLVSGNDVLLRFGI